MKYNSKSIWNCKQNKPSQIVDDIQALGWKKNFSLWTEGDIYEILLNRGVFKWLAVRRDLIRLKNKWKAKIRELYEEKPNPEAPWTSLHYNRGYRKALEDCRADVRALCHSERWRVQDNDRRAKEWLDRVGQQK